MERTEKNDPFVGTGSHRRSHSRHRFDRAQYLGRLKLGWSYEKAERFPSISPAHRALHVLLVRPVDLRTDGSGRKGGPTPKRSDHQGLASFAIKSGLDLAGAGALWHQDGMEK